jgi:hypothetical protein
MVASATAPRTAGKIQRDRAELASIEAGGGALIDVTGWAAGGVTFGGDDRAGGIGVSGRLGTGVSTATGAVPVSPNLKSSIDWKRSFALTASARISAASARGSISKPIWLGGRTWSSA